MNEQELAAMVAKMTRLVIGELPTTPASITPEIIEFAEQIVPGGEKPIYLDLEGDGTPGECFGNVGAHVEKWGGSVWVGWTIWLSSFLLEAEFHGVWKSPDGAPHDITQRPDGDKRILFLPDPVRAFTGIPVDNMRRPRIDHPIIRAFVTNAEKQFAVRLKYWRGHGQGSAIPMSEIMPLHAEALSLFRQCQELGEKPTPKERAETRTGHGQGSANPMSEIMPPQTEALRLFRQCRELAKQPTPKKRAEARKAIRRKLKRQTRG